MEREREGERERGREIERERERERCRIFLKGMTGALAPFSYLVKNYAEKCFREARILSIKARVVLTSPLLLGLSEQGQGLEAVVSLQLELPPGILYPEGQQIHRLET
jgi:hypothetical protein